jgi:hypothetical protein
VFTNNKVFKNNFNKKLQDFIKIATRGMLEHF